MKVVSILLGLMFGAAVLVCAADASPPEWIHRPRGNYAGHTARPLRYWPVGTDLVITNGLEFFNRPLYCDHSAFRVDGGDKPEFSLYLPGRGGNLRFGIKTPAGVKWLNDAAQIVARYRPGSLVYEIHDPLLGDGELRLAVLPLAEAKGLVVRAELRKTKIPVELVFAFGGANGLKGRRGGDIGCEREPVGEFFQLQPQECRGNEFSIAANAFRLRAKPATLLGVASAGTEFAMADANQWSSLDGLLNSCGGTNALPVAVGRAAFKSDDLYFALQPANAGDSIVITNDLPGLFSAAEQYRQAVAGRVAVETPDPFINAAVPALCVAADAIWDDRQQSFMHGAVAWRVRLLGWRGPYAGDELGWHDRTAAHFAGFARQQNTNPVPATLPPADADANLARNEAALHSNGDLTRSHYDMNLVGVDAFFRHLLWTGDLDDARQMWPVIVRHLAWERRLFRREYGPDKLPLYEAYAAIWASDNLEYDGGGTAHASAYNYFENKMAARVAKLIGQDPAPYEREADLILRGMQKYLWLPDEGHFAEFKDYLGLQLVHPSAGLWTFYNVMDSGVPTPAEAWQMSRWMDENIPHIPIEISSRSRREEALTSNSGLRTPNSGLLFTLPETSWMPYMWSLNNVVMAEAMHTSLGYWQADRLDAACALFKGSLLDSMYLGLCPGNLGAMTQFDVMRGESQRDFGDAIGITSRALVEGLFGVRPDALAGELTICPGFPADWDHAAIRHPDFRFEFHRAGLTETFLVEPKFPRPMKLILQIPALREQVGRVTVNGRPAKWKWLKHPGRPRIEIRSGAMARSDVEIAWNGGPAVPDFPPEPVRDALEGVAAPPTDWTRKIPAGVRLETVNLASVFNDRVTQIFKNEYRAPRSPFCSLALPKQGLGGWADDKQEFDVDDSGLRAVAAKSGGKLFLPNGVPFEIPTNAGAKNIVFTSQWDNYPREISVPLSGKSSQVFLLMAGSTDPMQSRLDNGEVVVTYADGTTARLALRNPVNWWPIEQDYFIDDYAFRRPEPIPPRVDLKTGRVRLLAVNAFKGQGGPVPGGAATVLDLPLDPGKELRALTVRALANEVVIGLMAATLERND